MNGRGCNKRVMVVEDDRDLRESIAEILQDNAYSPIGAANGQDALDCLHGSDGKPCVILLDIMMPVMDGWQFRVLQRRDPELSDIPVVVLTAHASIQEAARKMRAVAGLRKPVNVGTLLQTVERFCSEQTGPEGAGA